MLEYTPRKRLSVNELNHHHGYHHAQGTACRSDAPSFPMGPAHRRAVQRTFAGIVETIIETVLLFCIVSSLVGHFEIQQSSMEPSFSEGQRVVVSQLESALPAWVSRTAHATGTSGGDVFGLKRGDVVVFYDTPQRQGIPLIKRVIGVPGDTLTIRNGAVLINNLAIDEPYVHGVPTTCHHYCGPLTLEADEYFLMGDNRSGSRDSRSFGPIPASQMIGRVILRYWPLDQFGFY
ncbi:MAG: signal peptidase I [Chloroflexaceae bacterium]|nr:signal peptidase I [Chloroflexaceae bacterium]